MYCVVVVVVVVAVVYVCVCLSVCLSVCGCDRSYTHLVFDPYLISKKAPGKIAALTRMNKFKSSQTTT